MSRLALGTVWQRWRNEEPDALQAPGSDRINTMETTMLQPTIEEVAHHEAGHAVGMVHLEKDFIRVTVLPEVHKGRETLGYLKPRRYWSYHISNKIWAWAEDGGGEITDLRASRPLRA